MPQSRAPDELDSEGKPDLETILNRFDQDWRSGVVPRIEDYLPGPNGPTPDVRRTLLEELIAVDLQYRWRQKHSPNHCLESYTACFPELGPAQHLPLELIRWEYFARCCWGDRPHHEEYLARFPGRGVELRQALQQVDAELASELAGPQKPARLASPPGSAPDRSLTAASALVDALRCYKILGSSELDELSRLVPAQISEPRALARAWCNETG